MNATTLDAGIRSTDSLAAHARVSAVRQGYLVDPFISHLVPRARNLPTHAPLINIGTYVRSASIDSLVTDFLVAGESKKQIISLGAGSDTRYWRIAVLFYVSSVRLSTDLSSRQDLIGIAWRLMWN